MKRHTKYDEHIFYRWVLYLISVVHTKFLYSYIQGVTATGFRKQNTIKCKPIEVVVSQLRQFVQKCFNFLWKLKSNSTKLFT